MLSQQRWLKAWAGLDARPPDDLRARLLAAYAEPQRHYHTQQHLAECGLQFDRLAGLAERPAEVEIALWFHDAVYLPRQSDNEERSARWAREAALAAGVAAAAADRIHALVMATRHQAVPVGADEQVLVDADLSILGAGAERFAQYEEQIRAEYAWVPGFLYRRKRRQILGQFLARPHIFSTAPAREGLEGQARANLQAALARLG